MNQRLYLLNQLHKQGLDIRGLTHIFMGLDIAHFHYALPAIADQISINALHRIDAVLAKAFRWQLTSIVPSVADIVDNANKKLFHSALNPTHCLHHMLPLKKNARGRFIRFTGHDRVLPKAKPNVIRTASYQVFISLCLAYHRRYVIVYVSLLFLLYNILTI